MDYQKIRNYNELNDDEKFVVEFFREMKIECETAKYELMFYLISDLINEYLELQQLRNDIQERYFAVLKKINESEFADVDVDYKEWDEIRAYENTRWNEELESLTGFKHYLDDILYQFKNVAIKQQMIDEQ